jgi:hypothetical protein
MLYVDDIYGGEPEYLKFTPLSSSATSSSATSLVLYDYTCSKRLQYSTDKQNWVEVTPDKSGYYWTFDIEGITQPIYLEATTSAKMFGGYGVDYYSFSTVDDCEFSGPLTALLKDKFGTAGYKGELPGYGYYYLLEDNPSLKSVSSDLFGDVKSFGAVSCYYMFYNTGITSIPDIHTAKGGHSAFTYAFSACESLTDIELLDDTVNGDYCFYNAFINCTGLKTAKLPATTLSTRCYQSMFYGCTALTDIYLGYEGTDTSYTTGWMKNVTSTGVLHKAGEQYSAAGDDTYPSTWTQEQWTP